MRVIALRIITSIAVLVFFAAAAFGDENHYVNLPIGDRASGMAGAYTAISDDASGLYYNPAGVAYSTGRNLSASVNAYYNNQKTYKDVIGGNGWTRRSSSLLPNFFGIVQPLGDYKVGLSYAVPDSIMEDQSQVFGDLQLASSIQSYNPGVTVTSYTINFNDELNVYNFGPSVAKELTNNFSAGLTVYYYQKKELRVLNQLVKTSNGGFEWTNQYYHNNEQGVRPVLGFMWAPLDKLSLGLSLSKIFIYSSNTTFQSSYNRQGICISATDCNQSILPDGSVGTTEKRDYPTQVSFGAAWFPSQSLLISADVNYFTAVNEQVTTVGGVPFVLRPDTKAIANVAIGSEYYFSKNVAMRAGFYTNYANTPKITPGGVNQFEHIDLYGATASVSSFTRNTSVTLGGGYTFGSGKAQIVSNSGSIQDVESNGFIVFVSSSYSY